MKKNIIYIAIISCLLSACTDNNQNEEQQNLKDPLTTQPVSDAIPDSTRLVNDSVIVPDITPGNGSQTGRGDSLKKIEQ